MLIYLIFSRPLQLYDGSSPAAAIIGRGVRAHAVISIQQTVYGTPQITDTLSVDNAETVNFFLVTGFDILRNQRTQILRPERMEIQRPVDGEGLGLTLPM